MHIISLLVIFVRTLNIGMVISDIESNTIKLYYNHSNIQHELLI